MVGPTGCGKTEIARRLAKMCRCVRPRPKHLGNAQFNTRCVCASVRSGVLLCSPPPPLLVMRSRSLVDLSRTKVLCAEHHMPMPPILGRCCIIS